LIFVNKNWPNDPRIGYKSPSSLVDLIETHVDLEEELEDLKELLKGMKLWSFIFELKNLLQLTNFHLFLVIIKW